MKKTWLILIGLLPFLVGYIQDHLMLTAFYTLRVPYGLISFLYLGLWCLLGFLVYPVLSSVKQAVVLTHIPAFAVLLLVLFQEIVLGHYWLNPIGSVTQMFYLPLISLVARITFFSPSIPMIYIIAFLLMYGTFYFGCRLRRKSQAA